MYFIRLHLIFSLLLLSFSQGLTQAYLFDAQRFTAEDGLPDLFTAAITKDNDSFMWGATNNGLYQYDGYEFKNYPLEQRIQQIKVDEQNNLWLFSSRRKNTLFPDSQSIVNIDIFNTKTKEIIPFENYFAQSPPFLPNEVVLSKIIDSKKRLWVTTKKGELFLFQQGTFHKVYEKKDVFFNM